jgi:hypothetical protein
MKKVNIPYLSVIDQTHHQGGFGRTLFKQNENVMLY